tara:strand:- start:5857 stop:6624 length:768 start_codon:yes stop_codon:yes gene_type:complete
MILSSSIFGKGNPIIILHGLFGESKNWNSIANELAFNFEVHLIDQRNHGKSFHHDEHNYIALAEDVYNYIQFYRLEHYVIMGHSMGGKVAMQFAFMYPGKLKKLIIVDIAPKKYHDNHDIIFQGLNQVLLKASSRKEAYTILMGYINDAVTVNFLLKGFYLSEDDNPKFKFNYQALEKNIIHMLGGLKKHNNFNGMTYFVSGSKSNYIQSHDFEDISKLFPNNQMIQINNAGHWVHFEAKENFLRTIKTILKSHL